MVVVQAFRLSCRWSVCASPHSNAAAAPDNHGLARCDPLRHPRQAEHLVSIRVSRLCYIGPLPSPIMAPPDLNSLPHSSSPVPIPLRTTATTSMNIPTSTNGSINTSTSMSVTGDRGEAALRGESSSPSPRSASISLQAAATVNAGLQHESGRRKHNQIISLTRSLQQVDDQLMGSYHRSFGELPFAPTPIAPGRSTSICCSNGAFH